MRTVVASCGVALVITLVACWPLRRIALALNVMDRPGPRKSQTKPVPYFGGLAIFAGVAVSTLIFSPRLWPFVVLLGLLAALGLVDDVRYLPVWVKLCGETVLAATAVALGPSWHLTESVPVNDVLSVVWMVGLTNSFNLLDNMDGLASTVATVAVLAFTALSASAAALGPALAGASAAFLAINRPPARMYMGDAGSLMLGFGVALTSIAVANTSRGLHSVVLLGFPVAVALFDTSLVIVSRLMTGRPVQLGGRDHFSHRLLKLGLSRPQVLVVALAAALAAWAGTALALRYPLPDAWLAVPFGIAFVAAWGGLLRVDPYTSAVRPRIEIYGEQAHL